MTSTETRRAGFDRLNPRNWTLTWKLVAVGLVPALLALVLGILRVTDQAENASELGSNSKVLEVREKVANAANALRQERDSATLFVAAGRSGSRTPLDTGFGQTDGEIDTMRAAVGTADDPTTLNDIFGSASKVDPTIVSALRSAGSGLAQLPSLRSYVTDNPGVPSTQVIDQYTGVISTVDILERSLLRQLRTPGTAGLSDALISVSAVTEQLALEHTIVGAAIRANRLQDGDAGRLTVISNQLQSDAGEYRASLTPEQLDQFGNFIEDDTFGQLEQLKATVLAAPAGPFTLAPNVWDAAYSAARASADASGSPIRTQLVETSNAAQVRASNLAGINSVLLMLGLLAAIAIAVYIGRALIRSLRVLRTAALDVAQRRLPQAVESMRAGETPDLAVEPVPIASRDEVGQVARAFDAVHGQALRLAADQAVLQAGVSSMFVNLSRRSQALIERQLQLIEQLESNEQDADQLSNLFQLDHLATRMRRNSENLLVLAGTDLSKRNIAPVPMVDVLRAAVSEIERYQRIVVQAPPTVTILGRAASDLVHLLAELLDNATNFSPPDSQVVMSTTRAADGTIVVEIADRGVGMTDEELAEANKRLGGPSAVEVSTSRRMGLFVVGRLGIRHGVGVQLSSSAAGGPGSGLTAVVTVPAHLVPTGAAGVPQSGAGKGRGPVPAFGVPPQRGAVGPARTGAPPAALPSGPDGPPERDDAPIRPAASTSAPERPATPERPVPDAAPAADNPAANNTVNGLPTRRPGSSLRPSAPPEPGTAEQVFGPDMGAATRQGAPESLRDTPRPDPRSGNGVSPNGMPMRSPLRKPAPGQRPGTPPTADGPPPAPAKRGPGEPGEPTDRDTGARPAATPAVPSADGPQRERTPNGTPPRPAKPAGQDRADASTGDAVTGAAATGAAPSPVAKDRDGDGPATPDSKPGGLPKRQPAANLMPPVPQTRRPDQRPDQAGPRPDQPSPRPDQAGQRAGQPTSRPDQPGLRPDQPGPRPDRPGPRPDQRQDQDQDQQGHRPDHQDAPRPAAAAANGPGGNGDPVGIGGRNGNGGPPSPSVEPRTGPTPVLNAADQLFAPRVPSGGDLGSPDPGAPAFDMSETTPIFEEIASAWFRSNRPVPVDYSNEKDAPAPAGPSPSPRPSVADSVPFLPAPSPAAEPVEEERVGANALADQGFVSLADEGWRAARSTATESRGDELTAAGLPKRRPRARLIPGSAGSAVLAPLATPSRSAESIRGRLASYQQGVRMGRENRGRGDAESAPETDSGIEQNNKLGNQDEESS